MLGFLWMMMHAWWGNGGAVKVKGAKELCPGRQSGVEVRATEEVQSEFGLWEQEVPEVNGRIFVSAAKAGNKVVFKSADGMFSSVAVVDVVLCM